ncbi:MAG: hypothetical protein V8R82_01810 [Clostridia bacterium]
MQDNIVYKIELTDKEYNFIEKAKQEYYFKLSKMTKEQRLQYFRDKYLIENNLNFEKEINGTIYKVNAYFNDNLQESILEKVNRMIKNS